MISHCITASSGILKNHVAVTVTHCKPFPRTMYRTCAVPQKTTVKHKEFEERVAFCQRQPDARTLWLLVKLDKAS